MPRLLAAILLAAVMAGPAPSAFAGGQEPFLRTLLVLYNSESGDEPRYNLFREGMAVIANYQGLTPVYRDVSKRPLPSDKEMQGVRGMVTAFTTGRMSSPEEFLRWVIRQMDHGKQLLVLGGLGAHEDLDGRPVDPALPVEVLKRLGLGYSPDFLADQARLRYAFKDKDLTGFERPLPLFPPVYERYIPLNGTTPWITVRRTDAPDADTAVVSTSPAGGMAMWEYVSWQDPVSFRNQWYLDPFALLGRSMNIGDAPALTPTTSCGMRVAFSHIDADGFGGYSEVNASSFCGQVMMREIITKYDFPVTASLIQAETDPKLSGDERLLEGARRLMRLPNVEPASHTYSHPFYWDPDDTAKKKLYKEKHGLEQYGVKVEGYYFDSATEIIESCKWISEVVDPPLKPCKVLLWSGDCEPTVAQVEMCADHGLLNMNGGDTVYDAQQNSLFTVSPLYQPMGDTVQVYTGQANDNILTNEWTGPFYGFRYIIETMRRTGSPRRLMPIDIYYHFFSAEKYASIQALRDIYDWAVKQPTARMFASKYIKMVMDFVKARMFRRDDGAWIIEDYGTCASLRLADKSKVPDLARCQGVQGYFAAPEGTFVHLEPGKRAVVALADTDGGLPHLQWAEGVVRDFVVDHAGVRLDLECFGKGRLRLAGLKPGAAWEASGPSLEKPLTATVDPDGGLTIGPVASGALSLRIH